jgi:hypothetical protein
MAAMFQAQSANWEETQEKMSQLVSPLAVLPVSCSNFSNTHFRCPFYRRPFSLSLLSPFSLSARPGFTPVHVERVRAAVAEASHLPAPPTGRATAPTQLCVLSLWAERYVLYFTLHYRGRV